MKNVQERLPDSESGDLALNSCSVTSLLCDLCFPQWSQRVEIPVGCVCKYFIISTAVHTCEALPFTIVYLTFPSGPSRTQHRILSPSSTLISPWCQCYTWAPGKKSHTCQCSLSNDGGGEAEIAERRWGGDREGLKKPIRPGAWDDLILHLPERAASGF